MHTTPVRMARSPAAATAWASSAASGAMATAISGTSDESGPITRMRDGPKIAYAISGTIVA